MSFSMFLLMFITIMLVFDLFIYIDTFKKLKELEKSRKEILENEK